MFLKQTNNKLALKTKFRVYSKIGQGTSFKFCYLPTLPVRFLFKKKNKNARKKERTQVP